MTVAKILVFIAIALLPLISTYWSLLEANAKVCVRDGSCDGQGEQKPSLTVASPTFRTTRTAVQPGSVVGVKRTGQYLLHKRMQTLLHTGNVPLLSSTAPTSRTPAPHQRSVKSSPLLLDAIRRSLQRRHASASDSTRSTELQRRELTVRFPYYDHRHDFSLASRHRRFGVAAQTRRIHLYIDLFKQAGLHHPLLVSPMVETDVRC